MKGEKKGQTFKQELPQSEHSRFRWFLTGVVLFILLHFLAGEDFFSDRIL